MSLRISTDEAAFDHSPLAKAWGDRRCRGIVRHPVLAPAGLILGAGTLLAKRADDARAPQALDFDADRLLALLASAYDRPHTAEQARRILAKVRAAGRALAADEPVQAAIHLAHAGLGVLPDADIAAWRLFLAETLLDQGISSAALMKAAGFAVAKYTADQPRDGRGRWTSEGGHDTASASSGPRFIATPDAEDGGLSRPLAARAVGSTSTSGKQWRSAWETQPDSQLRAAVASAEESENGHIDSFGYQAFKHNPNRNNKNPDAGDNNALGRYQFLEDSLVGLGIKTGRHANECDSDFGRKYGIKNDTDFLNNEDAQEASFSLYKKDVDRQINKIYLDYEGSKFVGVHGQSIKITKSGLFAAYHRVGIGGLKSYLRRYKGKDTKGRPLTDHEKWVETRLRLFQDVPYEN
ncbi:hypothetical protein [Nitrospirillum sp. BR 11828]|uniref:hypothetical protein n=1 Tax=Nitrospirillum sp. BR 11828 TaxID=3104325 RepID=UPI002ACA1002|nr:hypothetical protein [Nitrospirillum sp. BR 11828]MDZ5648969.1 hypothetical protein [Nitrospirillum sp. BR 11828]